MKTFIDSLKKKLPAKPKETILSFVDKCKEDVKNGIPEEIVRKYAKKNLEAMKKLNPTEDIKKAAKDIEDWLGKTK